MAILAAASSEHWSVPLTCFQVCPPVFEGLLGHNAPGRTPAPDIPPVFPQSTNLMQNLPRFTTFKGSPLRLLKSRILHLRGGVLCPLLGNKYFETDSTNDKDKSLLEPWRF